MTNIFQNLMRVARRLTKAGRLNGATKAIQRALSGVGGNVAAPHHPTNSRAAGIRGSAVGFVRPTSPPRFIDDSALDADAAPPVAEATVFIDALARGASCSAPQATPFPNRSDDNTAAERGTGTFADRSHMQASQTHRYKLYAPPGHAGRQLPLVVMLHGCSQDPDDFAAGTGMNDVAQEQGFFVLYPAQSRGANPSGCWNWFKHNDQQRDGGEPAVIAAMTRAVMKEHDIDPQRVYIAGLSAGGAMAAIVAEAYPEIFAAVGVHSGLPRGAASSVFEAFAVMRSGDASRNSAARASSLRQLKPVPTIVFHGDLDQTVHPRNGEQVIAAVLGDAAAAAVERGVSPRGRHYTRSTHHDDNGHALAEHWLVHGAGHAWSGGNAEGSYTDAEGPDATRAMLRFFFEQPQGLRH